MKKLELIRTVKVFVFLMASMTFTTRAAVIILNTGDAWSPAIPADFGIGGHGVANTSSTLTTGGLTITASSTGGILEHFINAFGVGKGSQNNSALFGQCMLISATTYQQVGGHHVVKSHILENFHLAENLKSLGIHLNCYLGRDIITMRMFPEGLSELWNSWKKGFSAGAVHKQLANSRLTPPQLPVRARDVASPSRSPSTSPLRRGSIRGRSPAVYGGRP